MYAQYVQNTTMPLNITDVTKDLRFPWTVSPMLLTPLALVPHCSWYCIVFFLIVAHVIEDGCSEFFVEWTMFQVSIHLMI